MIVKAGDILQCYGDMQPNDSHRFCYTAGDEFTVMEDGNGFFIICKWPADNSHRIAEKNGEVWDTNLRLMSGEKEL